MKNTNKKKLLDTDIFSEVLKRKNKNVERKAEEYYKIFDTYTISMFTIIEILTGFYEAGYYEKANRFWASVPNWEVLNIDMESSEIVSRLYAVLSKEGTPIGYFDPLIAAIAIRYDLPLVTGNTKHYQRIIDIGYYLELENWKE